MMRRNPDPGSNMNRSNVWSRMGIDFYALTIAIREVAGKDMLIQIMRRKNQIMDGWRKEKSGGIAKR